MQSGLLLVLQPYVSHAHMAKDAALTFEASTTMVVFYLQDPPRRQMLALLLKFCLDGRTIREDHEKGMESVVRISLFPLACWLSKHSPRLASRKSHGIG